MDELQEWEINTMIQNIPYMNRNEKELERYKLFVSVQSNSKKKIKLEEILSFPWDKEQLSTTTKITEDEARELRNRAHELEKKIQQNAMKSETVDLTRLMSTTQQIKNQ